MDKRKKYWEQSYVKYWKDRVSVSSTNLLATKDTVPPDEAVFSKYYSRALCYLDKKPTILLDIGIGFGRFVPLYKKVFGKNIWGSDISKSMIQECIKNFPSISEHMVVAPAEKQPLMSNFFDFIVCWAAFDATYQDKTLWEFQRLLKIGGLALISGKNANYYKNDKKALIAEINARKKGHPNFFTDIKTLIPHLNELGFKLLNLYCYKRRGDAVKDLSFKGLKNKFYEYILIIQKDKNVKKRRLSFIIADKFSQTFRNKNV